VSDPRPFTYQGRELDVFATAANWKAYWSSRIRRWIGGDVLEVGAGQGVNTLLLHGAGVRSWLCQEPDPALAAAARNAVSDTPGCSVQVGTIESIGSLKFDSILYIDVLEHIEADREELAAASRALREGGHLIVLSPAHQFLFSQFDASIGHYRRYNRASLRACSPPDCSLDAMFYLDCAGVMASLGNRILLRRDQPAQAHIDFWDTCLVPVSQMVDRVFGYRLGKTICGVWTKLDRGV